MMKTGRVIDLCVCNVPGEGDTMVVQSAAVQKGGLCYSSSEKTSPNASTTPDHDQRSEVDNESDVIDVVGCRGSQRILVLLCHRCIVNLVTG